MVTYTYRQQRADNGPGSGTATHVSALSDAACYDLFRREQAGQQRAAQNIGEYIRVARLDSARGQRVDQAFAHDDLLLRAVGHDHDQLP